MEKIIAYIDTDNDNLLHECKWWSSREQLGVTKKDCPFPYPHGLVNRKDLYKYG